MVHIPQKPGGFQSLACIIAARDVPAKASSNRSPSAHSRRRSRAWGRRGAPGRSALPRRAARTPGSVSNPDRWRGRSTGHADRRSCCRRTQKKVRITRSTRRKITPRSARGRVLCASRGGAQSPCAKRHKFFLRALRGFIFLCVLRVILSFVFLTFGLFDASSHHRCPD
jgi:hypothetical protein